MPLRRIDHCHYVLTINKNIILLEFIDSCPLDVFDAGCHLIDSEGNISQSAPTLAFSSETETVALVGESATLRCFFYG